MLHRKKVNSDLMPEEVDPASLKKLPSLPHIQVKGLDDNCSICRKSRRKSYNFQLIYVNYLLTLTQKNIDNVNVSILSMGMTNDYEVAIEEGATMVRVGTGIFGARNYSI